MVRRTGSADLPLHGGRVPKWLAELSTVSLSFGLNRPNQVNDTPLSGQASKP
jgi:hypothetical protein